MELIGYIACALIGMSLGLIGAGGSILMVPVLVFLFDMPPILTSSYSLFVVGITSLFATVGKYRQGEVLLGPALAFGASSMIVVVLIRHFVIPFLPKSFGMIGHAVLSYDLLSMILFAGLMILAACFMINKAEKACPEHVSGQGKVLASVPYAILVGVVTGFLGAGGGFIIIPVMTLLLGLNIKKAVGTSLAVIAMNSLSGFLNDLQKLEIDWKFLILITVIALAGSLAGSQLSTGINPKRLKAVFGWFVLLLGIAIITFEGYHIMRVI